VGRVFPAIHAEAARQRAGGERSSCWSRRSAAIGEAVSRRRACGKVTSRADREAPYVQDKDTGLIYARSLYIYRKRTVSATPR